MGATSLGALPNRNSITTTESRSSMQRKSFCNLRLWLVVALANTAGWSQAGEPLKLHPDNSHYFLFRGKPTVLIGSGEHYGAVLNHDIDFRTYLDTLQAEGMNLTRAVPGTSLESTNAGTYRGGDQNTFAPRPGRFLAPWARSDTPGYFYGGNKFDLDRWDER